MKHVEIHTDGACSGNPGPGGYGTVLTYKEHRKELSGGFARSTNNRMEIFAAIVGLEALKEGCKIVLYSDSSYLVNAVKERWLLRWQHNGWRKADKKPVQNADLWKRLATAMTPHQVEFVWVKGHAANADNNRCDELARSAASSSKLTEDSGYLTEDDAVLFAK